MEITQGFFHQLTSGRVFTQHGIQLITQTSDDASRLQPLTTFTDLLRRQFTLFIPTFQAIKFGYATKDVTVRLKGADLAITQNMLQGRIAQVPLRKTKAVAHPY